jgi:hypothetical protein
MRTSSKNNIENNRTLWLEKLMFLTIYGAMVIVMYLFTSAKIITPQDFTEAEERDFHIAAVNVTKNEASANSAEFVSYSLYQLKTGKVDLKSVSFLLPEKALRPPENDIHKVTILESNSDSQIIEYYYANSHNSVSKYRSFHDHIEPVSYRISMSFAVFVWGVFLLFPAKIVSRFMSLYISR